MPKTHRWEDLLPEEFYEEFERAPIVYWPCGPIEEHGLQNAVGVDPYVAHEVCLRAAKLSGGIVFPPVPFGPAYFPGLSHAELRSKAKPLFPPSVWISHDLCERIYIELMESLADLGFRACLANSGHGPGDWLLQDLEKRFNGRIGNMRFWGGGIFRLLCDELAKLGREGHLPGDRAFRCEDFHGLEDAVREQPLAGNHGDMWETSLVMAIRPDWVDLPRAQRIHESKADSQLKPLAPESIAYIAHANAEMGNRTLDLAAQRLAKVAKTFLGEIAPI